MSEPTPEELRLAGELDAGPWAVAVERFPQVRQSRLATFDRCALSAHFEEEYEYGYSSAPQARGTVFHRVAARALREMYERQERSIPTDAAIEMLEDELRQADADSECPSCAGPIVRRYMADPTEEQEARGVEVGFPRIVCAKGHDHTSSFVNLPMSEVKDLRWVVVKWSHEGDFDIENLVDVEHRMTAEIRYPTAEGDLVTRRLTGALDAVFVQGDHDEHFVVLDWKDSWGLPGPTDVGFDGYFQQRFYAWLIFREFPSADVVTLREFYVRFGEAREATVYRSDMEDIERELSALTERFDRAFAEHVFPPTAGFHCQFCPRPAACPIFPGVRREGTISNARTAARFAQEAQVAKAALKDRTTALEAWGRVHGPTAVSTHKGNRGWAHKTITRTSRPKKEDIEQKLRVSGGKLTPADIEALYKTSKGTRFGLIDLDKEMVPDPTADDARLMNALSESLPKEP